MNKDTRLSDVLHVLMHMGRVSRPLSSEVLAKAMGTNPAVFRRTMAGLRNAGYVNAEKGAHGGWSLAKPLAKITLLDVYDALGRPTLFAIGSRARSSDCSVERSVNASLADTLAAAEALFIERFGTLTLEQVAPETSTSLSVHCRQSG